MPQLLRRHLVEHHWLLVATQLLPLRSRHLQPQRWQLVGISLPFLPDWHILEPCRLCLLPTLFEWADEQHGIHKPKSLLISFSPSPFIFYLCLSRPTSLPSKLVNILRWLSSRLLPHQLVLLPLPYG